MRFFINSPKYSDALYFDIADSISDATQMAYELAIHKFKVFRPHWLSYILELPLSEIAGYTKLVIDNNGELKKGPTNPVTGTTREGYQKAAFVNADDYKRSLLSEVVHTVEHQQHIDKALKMLELVVSLIGELPDGGFTTDLPQIFKAPYRIDEATLKKLYELFLRSHFVNTQTKQDLINMIDSIGDQHNYSTELRNYIRSIPIQ